MTHNHTFRFNSLLCLIFFGTSSLWAQSTCDFDTLVRYNVISLTGADIWNSDIEGRSIFGGNLRSGNFSYGLALPANSGYTVLVNGNADIPGVGTNIATFNGNVVVSGSVINGGVINTNGYSLQTNTALPFNVSNAQTLLQNRANTWKNIAATGSVNVSGGVVTLDGGNASGVVVFNLTGGTHTATSGGNTNGIWRYSFANLQNANSILINVSGTDVKFNAGNFLGYPSSNKMIWNFHQATLLEISNWGFKGSVLAPWASLNFNSAHIDGHIFVNYLSGSNGEAHYRSFLGQIGTACTFNPPIINRQSICNTTTPCDGTSDGIDMPNFYTGSGAGANYRFLWGEFVEYGNGTALFYGRIENTGNTNIKFDVQFNFSGRTTSPGTGNPWNPNSCTPSSTTGWIFYTGMTGTLTGIEGTDTEGVITLLNKSGTQHIQLGSGASGNQTNATGMGASFNGTVIVNGGKPVANFTNGALEWIYCNQPVCDNLTSAGVIGSNQSVCGTSLDPANLNDNVSPSGGTGVLEYQWQISTDNSSWTDISGATGANYNPPSITATRHYRRNARRATCTWLSSNVVTASVNAVPTVAPSANTPCVGNNLILYSNASISSGSITTYAWSGPGGWTNTTGNSNSNRRIGDIGAAGTYSVTVTSNAGCTATGTVNVSVTNPITVSNIPANTTVNCAANIPTASPTFAANCCSPITSVQQYNAYPNCSNPYIQTNGGFETVGSATFSSTFQGYPAQALPNGSTLMPGWEMGFGGCTPTCSDGIWVHDNTNTINNPEGSRFIYFGGTEGGYCAVSYSPITLAANGCAELCFNAAAWATTGSQTPTQLDIEYVFNGTLTKIYTVYLPASTSFQNLNWQDLCFNFTAPSAGTYSFVVTVNTQGASNKAAGAAIDNVRVRECCPNTNIITNCNYTFTKYWMATDNCGNNALVSQKVTINDTQAPTLSGVPANITACTPPSVPNVTANDNCNGSITPTYVQTSTQTANGSCTDGNYILTRRWTATDECGNATTGTQIITLVTPSVSASGATTICTGGTVTLTATMPCAMGATYQWQQLIGAAWTNVGANSSSYTTVALTNTTEFRVVVTTTTGGCQATSNTQTVTVVADPSINVVASTTGVCVGGSVVLNATPNGGTGTCMIQWQSYNGSTWSNLAGETNNTYTTPTLNTQTRYRAQINCSGNGCCN